MSLGWLCVAMVGAGVSGFVWRVMELAGITGGDSGCEKQEEN